MNNKFSISRLSLAMALVALPSGLLADDSVISVKQDMANKIKIQENLTPENGKILGENYNVYTGSVTFAHTDITISGNNKLPFKLGRVIKNRSKLLAGEVAAFGDWELDIPRIEATTTPSWKEDRCTRFHSDGGATLGFWQDGFFFGLHTVQSSDYWTGANLIIPDESTEMLQNPNSTASGADLVTQGNWKLNCNVTASDGGEGFVAYSPKGLKYTFAQLKYSDARRSIARVDIGINQGRDNFYIKQSQMLVSKIEDLHGNYMQFNYDSNSRLTKITANDGASPREITLTYGSALNSNLVTKISSGTRHWNYTYTKDSKNRPILTSVSLPSGESWTMNMGQLAYNRPETPKDKYKLKCAYDDNRRNSASGFIQHPTGLKGDFYFGETSHGMVNVEYESSESKRLPKCMDVMSLNRKAISGPNMSTYNWYYNYSESKGNYTNESIQPATKTTTVTEPHNTTLVYHLNRTYDWREGLIDKVLVKQGSTLLRTITNSYQKGNVVGNTTVSQANIENSENYIKLTSSVTNQNGVNYSAAYSNFDDYNNPKTIVESNGTKSRTRQVTYFNNTSNWIIGEKQTDIMTELVNGTTHTVSSLSNVFNSKGQKTSITKDGLTETFTYNGATLSSHTDARQKVTSYSDYYRGIPRTVNYPVGSLTHVVSPYGKITSRTNEENHTTGYTFDNADRLTKIDYPAGSDLVITYSGSTMTRTRSNYRETHALDGYNRSTLITQQDTTNNITRYKRNTYDARGRMTYESITSDNTAASIGVTTGYDSLNRTTSITTPSGTTNYVYKDNNTMEKTAPGNVKTTYTYLAYDDPNKNYLIGSTESTQAGSKVTSYTRNAAGRLDSVTQGGKTISYGYNNHHQITSEVHPEMTIYYGRDASGNMTSRRVGTGPTTTFTYDDMNRRLTTNYPDSSDDITMTYFATGDVKTANAGNSTWTYTYDKNRNMTKREHKWHASTQAFNFTFDNQGHLSTMTYPSGLSVDYAPNAFGEATKVGTFASSVEHHPNGILKSVTYDNGITYSFELDTATARISSIVGIKDNNAVFEKNYQYDARDNVTGVVDTVRPSNSVTNITYDGVNQITSASSTSFGGGVINYEYDLLGNIKKVSRGNVVANYSYDSRNRLSSVSGGYPYNFSYDNSGNVTGNGWNTFTYNEAGVMTGVGGNGAKNYTYDAFGRRLFITEGNSSTYELYSDNDKLLVASEKSGVIREKIYLGRHLIAQKRSSN